MLENSAPTSAQVAAVHDTAVSRLPAAARRLFVTLGAIGAALIAQAIPVPMLRLPFSGAQIPGVARPSLLAVGLAPIISAFIIVELLSLLLPRWRHWRRFPDSGRASLRLRAEILGLILALTQALRWARISAHEEVPLGSLSSPLLAAVVVVASLLAGTCLLLALARIIDRRGLGNGITVLLAGSSLFMLAKTSHAVWLQLQSGELAPGALALALGILTGVVMATLRLFTQEQPLAAGFKAPQPAAGVIPVSLTAALLGTFFGIRAMLAHPTAPQQGLPLLLIELALVLAFGVLFTRLFNPRQAVAATRAKVLHLIGADAAEHGDDAPEVLTRSVAYVLLLTIAAWFVRDQLQVSLIHVTTLALITAVGFDIFRDWRAYSSGTAWVRIGEVHAPWQMGPLTFAARAQGITLHLRAAGARTLSHFFGPYIPIGVEVATADRARAEELLRSLDLLDPIANSDPKKE
jgi:preprotein translocase subunit SecY